MNFLKNQVNLLVQNKPDQVIKNLDEKYENVNTKLSVMSNIRMKFIEKNIYHPEYEKILSLIKRVVKKLMPDLLEDLKKFSKMPLKEKYLIKKSIISKGHYFENDLDLLIKKLPILPTAFHQLKPSEKDAKIKILNQEKSLSEKHKNTITINTKELTDRLLKNIENEENINLVYIGVLLACGRRKSEIISGKFTPVVGNTKECLFFGQLKKRMNEPEYKIPLLIEYDIFIKSLKKVKYYFRDCDTNKKYHNKTRKIEIYLKKNFPPINNLHMLRSIYAIICDDTIDHEGSSNNYIMKILGQDSLSSTLHYSSITLT